MYWHPNRLWLRLDLEFVDCRSFPLLKPLLNQVRAMGSGCLQALLEPHEALPEVQTSSMGGRAF